MVYTITPIAGAENTILNWVDLIITGIEALAIIIIVIAIVSATISYLNGRFFRRPGTDLHREYRRRLAQAILMGLEILIAADVIRTVALDRTFEAIAVLGLLVIVRVILSWSLLVEIEGRWPWQPKVKNGAGKED